MGKKKIIIYIAVIVIILAAVYFSQQPYAPGMVESFFSYLNKYAGASLMGGFNLNSKSTNSSNNSATGTANESASNNQDNASNKGKNIIGTASNSSAAKLVDKATAPTGIAGFIAKGAEVVSGVTANIGESIKSGGAAIINGTASTVESAKNIPENILTKTENYFSNVTNSILGKPDSNCQTPTP